MDNLERLRKKQSKEATQKEEDGPLLDLSDLYPLAGLVGLASYLIWG